MESLLIRKAALADLGTLLGFEQAIIETERPFDPTLRDGGDLHYYDLGAMIISPDAEVLVAELGRKIIGSGYALIRTSEPYLTHRKHAYLGFMYVVPEHRGKGVNKLVLKALEEWSLSQGVSEMRLEVYVANTGAIRAYEKSGYMGHMLEMRRRLRED